MNIYDIDSNNWKVVKPFLKSQVSKGVISTCNSGWYKEETFIGDTSAMYGEMAMYGTSVGVILHGLIQKYVQHVVLDKTDYNPITLEKIISWYKEQDIRVIYIVDKSKPELGVKYKKQFRKAYIKVVKELSRAGVRTAIIKHKQMHNYYINELGNLCRIL